MEAISVNNKDRVAQFALRAAFLIIGLVSIPIGIVWLPVFGLIFSFLLIWLALSPNLLGPVRRSIRILVGSRSLGGMRMNPLLPVAILSTPRTRGNRSGFDATAVDPSSVRLERNGVAPLSGPHSSGESSEHLADMDGDGNPDMVFYFPLKDVEVSGAEEVCIIGKTVDGQAIRGCTRLGSVAQ